MPKQTFDLWRKEFEEVYKKRTACVWADHCRDEEPDSLKSQYDEGYSPDRTVQAWIEKFGLTDLGDSVSEDAVNEDCLAGWECPSCGHTTALAEFVAEPMAELTAIRNELSLLVGEDPTAALSSPMECIEMLKSGIDKLKRQIAGS